MTNLADKIKDTFSLKNSGKGGITKGLVLGMVLSAVFAGIMSSILLIKMPDTSKEDSNYRLYSPSKKQLLEFTKLYDYALTHYADKDKDGFVTSSEIDEFDKELLRDKGVNLINGNMPRDYNGNLVPQEKINYWLKEYIRTH